MWIAYFAVAIAVLALAILLFYFARRRASAAPDAPSSSEYVTIASMFVSVAALLVALAALYVAFQALGQNRVPAKEPAAAIRPQPAAPEAAKSMPQPANAATSEALPTTKPAASHPEPVAATSAASSPAPAPAVRSPTKPAVASKAAAAAATTVAAAPAAAPSPTRPATAAKATAAAAPPPVPARSPAPKPAATVAPPKASAAPAGKAQPAKQAPPSVLESKAAEADTPDVRLEFEMSRAALGVTLVNDSASDPAAPVSCLARLWDLDDPDNDSFSHPITIHCGSASLGPRAARGPVRLVKGPSSEPRVIEKGDRFFGYVAVSCPGCAEARSYAVYFVLGARQGWYATEDRSDVVTVEFTRGTAVAAAKQFLARSDKLPIRAFGGL
jgi:hypothetical protein